MRMPSPPPSAASSQILGQHLPGDPPAARAERRANGQLARTARRPRQQQVGEVRTRDQQHQSHGCHEENQRHPYITDDPVLHRPEADTHLGVGVRVFLLEVRGNALQIVLGLRDRHAGSQASDRTQVVRPSLREEGRVDRLGRPQLDARIRETEGRRHHANHSVGERVDLDVTPDDRGIGGEASLPQCMTEDRDAVLAGHLFVLDEVSAERRLNAQGAEHVDRHPQTAQPFGLGAFRIQDAGREHGRAILHARVERDVLERPVARLPVHQVGGRRRRARPVAQRVRLPDLHEPVRLVQRQRLEQDAVDDGEDGGVGADAERQREGGDQGERFLCREHSPCVPEVLQQHLESPLLLAKPERVWEGAEGMTNQRRRSSSARLAPGELCEPLTAEVVAMSGRREKRRGVDDPAREPLLCFRCVSTVACFRCVSAVAHARPLAVIGFSAR